MYGGSRTSRAAAHVSKRITQKQKRTEEKSITRGGISEALLNRTVGMYKSLSHSNGHHVNAELVFWNVDNEEMCLIAVKYFVDRIKSTKS